MAPAVSKETLERLAIPQEIFSSMVAEINGVSPILQQAQIVASRFTAIFHRDLILEMAKNQNVKDAVSTYGESTRGWEDIIKRTKSLKGPFVSNYRTNSNFAQNEDCWNGLLPTIAAALRGESYVEFVNRIYNLHGCTSADGSWLEAVVRPGILFTSVRGALQRLILVSLEEISKDYSKRLEKNKPGKDLRIWA